MSEVRSLPTEGIAGRRLAVLTKQTVFEAMPKDVQDKVLTEIKTVDMSENNQRARALVLTELSKTLFGFSDSIAVPPIVGINMTPMKMTSSKFFFDKSRIAFEAYRKLDMEVVDLQPCIGAAADAEVIVPAVNCIGYVVLGRPKDLMASPSVVKVTNVLTKLDFADSYSETVPLTIDNTAEGNVKLNESVKTASTFSADVIPRGNFGFFIPNIMAQTKMSYDGATVTKEVNPSASNVMIYGTSTLTLNAEGNDVYVYPVFLSRAEADIYSDICMGVATPEDYITWATRLIQRYDEGSRLTY